SLVAVADVGAVVAKDSAIDQHARGNTTSVYTAAQIFPMLPEKLSTDWTSLNEGETRVAIIIEYDVAGDGSTVNTAVGRAIVRNTAKPPSPSVGGGPPGAGAHPHPAAPAAGQSAHPPGPAPGGPAAAATPRTARRVE